MKLHPFEDCVRIAAAQVRNGVEVYQQFLCEHCRVKQTIESCNAFHTHGKCEECGKVTNIKKNGCNYMTILTTTGSMSTPDERLTIYQSDETKYG